MEWREEWRPRQANHPLVMSEQDLEAYPCWYLDEAHSIPPGPSSSPGAGFKETATVTYGRPSPLGSLAAEERTGGR